MTRRVLTAMGSATAVAAAVGACLLLGPTPQAQAGTIGNCATGCVTFDSTNHKITATNGSKSAFVQFFSNMVCAGTSSTDQQCKTF